MDRQKEKGSQEHSERERITSRCRKRKDHMWMQKEKGSQIDAERERITCTFRKRNDHRWMLKEKGSQVNVAATRVVTRIARVVTTQLPLCESEFKSQGVFIIIYDRPSFHSSNLKMPHLVYFKYQ